MLPDIFVHLALVLDHTTGLLWALGVLEEAGEGLQGVEEAGACAEGWSQEAFARPISFIPTASLRPMKMGFGTLSVFSALLCEISLRDKCLTFLGGG